MAFVKDFGEEPIVEKNRFMDYNSSVMKLNEKNSARKVGTAAKNDYDSAWKDVIEKFFKEFLEFFFPQIHEAIDYSEEIVFLSKELRRIVPVSKVGKRHSDVLVKVQLKDGSTKYLCIYIHIEVQAQPVPDFMERMYIYNYRSFDKYRDEGNRVISLAILTDEKENYRPDEYKVDLFGFELRMKIPIVKILDFKLKDEFRDKLNKSQSPMAMVVEAQLKSHEVKKAGDSRRLDVSLELIRQCYKKGYTKDEIRTLLNFIEWVIRVPETLQERLFDEIVKIEEELKMAYIPSWERAAEKRGEEKGIMQGMERGMERGLERGMTRGMEMTAIETAKRALKEGLSIEQVCRISGLSRSEIEKLAANTH